MLGAKHDLSFIELRRLKKYLEHSENLYQLSSALLGLVVKYIKFRADELCALHVSEWIFDSSPSLICRNLSFKV